MNESTPVNHAADTTATRMIVRAGDPSLVQQAESPDPRTELYARLRTIIETATESVRTLRDENAALKREVADMSERNAALDRRLRAATVDLESDERALRESADLLDQLLRGRSPCRRRRTATPNPRRRAKCQRLHPQTTWRPLKTRRTCEWQNPSRCRATAYLGGQIDRRGTGLSIGRLRATTALTRADSPGRSGTWEWQCGYS
jgi:hypothetical protein